MSDMHVASPLVGLELHNDRFISKAKPCLMEAICYGAPSISYVNALAACDPIPISEVSIPSSSLILPSRGGRSSHMRR